MVTSAAVGYPLENVPSDFRIAMVYSDRIGPEHYGFDDVPDPVDL